MSASTSPRALHHRLISIVEPVCQAAGYELFELRFVLEQGGWTLRVAIDLPLDQHGSPDEVPSDRVDLEACENLSRELSAVLDVEDPIPQAFHLEVSSPGIERPLRTAQHFRFFTGSEARIQLATPLHLPSGDRRNFKGILQGVGDDGAVAIECDGAVFRLPLEDIEHARLVADWDAVMKGKSGVGRPTARPVKPGHRASQRRAESRKQPAHSTHASRQVAQGSPQVAQGSPQGASQTSPQAASQAAPPSPRASASDADNKEQG